jgi:hypothetical protein
VGRRRTGVVGKRTRRWRETAQAAGDWGQTRGRVRRRSRWDGGERVEPATAGGGAVSRGRWSGESTPAWRRPTNVRGGDCTIDPGNCRTCRGDCMCETANCAGLPKWTGLKRLSADATSRRRGQLGGNADGRNAASRSGWPGIPGRPATLPYRGLTRLAPALATMPGPGSARVVRTGHGDGSESGSTRRRERRSRLPMRSESAGSRTTVRHDDPSRSGFEPEAPPAAWGVGRSGPCSGAVLPGRVLVVGQEFGWEFPGATIESRRGFVGLTRSVRRAVLHRPPRSRRRCG